MFKLIGMIVAGFASIIPMFITFLGRKYTVAVASIAAFVAITAGMIVALKSIVVTIAAYLTMPSWLATMAWFIPSDFVPVSAALLSAHITRSVYDMAVAKIQLVNSAS